MTQINDILKLASEVQRNNNDAVVATVVRTEGSAYRRAGAMMLICADGRSVGMISGGCLEPHIIKRAFWLTRHGATVQVYQTGDEHETIDEGIDKEHSVDASDDASDDDDASHDIDFDWNSELNFGLGCNGSVHVLFERIATALPLLESIRQVRHSQQPMLIATVVHSSASKSHLNSQIRTGMRFDLGAYIQSGRAKALTFNADGFDIITDLDSVSNFDNVSDFDSVKGLNGSDSSDNSVVVDTLMQHLVAHRIDDDPTQYVFLQDKGVTTEWLIQRIQPQIRLLICGAGDDVKPLVTMAKLQDWHVTVIDSRPNYATRLRFPHADSVMPLALEACDTLLALSQNAAIALMSHSLTQDRARLSILLEHADTYAYIGQLGPRYRTERLIKEIRATKVNPIVLEDAVNKLHYPIGYKLGGDGPEALALSIMAEINAVMHEQRLPKQPVYMLASDSDRTVSQL